MVEVNPKLGQVDELVELGFVGSFAQAGIVHCELVRPPPRQGVLHILGGLLLFAILSTPKLKDLTELLRFRFIRIIQLEGLALVSHPTEEVREFICHLLQVFWAHVHLMPKMGKLLSLDKCFDILHFLVEVLILSVPVPPSHGVIQLLGRPLSLLCGKVLEVMLGHSQVTMPLCDGIEELLLANHGRHRIQAHFHVVVILALVLPPVHRVDHVLHGLLRLCSTEVVGIETRPLHHALLEAHELLTLRGGHVHAGEVKVLAVGTPHVNHSRQLLAQVLGALPGEGLLGVTWLPHIQECLDVVDIDDFDWGSLDRVELVPILAPPGKCSLHVGDDAVGGILVQRLGRGKSPIDHRLLEAAELVAIFAFHIKHRSVIFVAAEHDQGVGDVLQVLRGRVCLESPKGHEALCLLEVRHFLWAGVFQVELVANVTVPSHNVLHLFGHALG